MPESMLMPNAHWRPRAFTRGKGPQQRITQAAPESIVANGKTAAEANAIFACQVFGNRSVETAFDIDAMHQGKHFRYGSLWDSMEHLRP